MITPKRRINSLVLLPVFIVLAVWGFSNFLQNSQPQADPSTAAFAYQENAGHFQEMVLESRTTLTRTYYIPYMYKSEQEYPFTMTYTIPVTVMSAAIWGYNFDEAVANQSFAGITDQFGVVIRPAEADTYYIISRSFLAWELPDIPPGYLMTSATLSFQWYCQQMENMPDGERLLFHRGQWHTFFTEPGEMWDSYAEETTVAVPLIPGCQPQTVVLDPSLLEPGSVNRLLARFERDLIDLRHAESDNSSLYSARQSILEPGQQPFITIYLRLAQ
jgi:hypothetical protein